MNDSLLKRPKSNSGNEPPADRRMTLAEMIFAFLKIGALGFGGGMAVVALIERECVLRRQCVETEEFLHGVGLGQLLGPFAVNASIFIGYRMFGLVGGLVAAVAFLFPSIVLVILLSWLYFSFHKIPALQGALTGLGPVVIALILSAAWSMGRKSVRTPTAFTIAALGCLFTLLRINATYILGAAGAFGLIAKLAGSASAPLNQRRLDPVKSLPLLMVGNGQTDSAPGLSGAIPQLSAPGGMLAAGTLTVGLGSLAWVFLKIGMVFFGGGFVLIPILYHKLVVNLGWMTQQEFMDGTAISQLTPGPIAVLATFAGYKVAGVAGALVATAALFAPAMILMLVIAHFYRRLHQAQSVRHFLAGIVPTVVGMVVAAAIALAPGSVSLVKPLGLIFCVLALILLSRWKWHPAFVLTIGAVLGIAFPHLIR